MIVIMFNAKLIFAVIFICFNVMIYDNYFCVVLLDLGGCPFWVECN